MMVGLEAGGMDVPSQTSLGSPREPAGSSVSHGHQPWWSELLLLFQGKQGACWDRFGGAGAGSISGCPARGTSPAGAADTWWLCPGETCPGTSTLPVQSPALNAADWADACCPLPDELSFVISCNRTCQHSS